MGELIEANNDATLEELRYLLYGKIGFSVSRGIDIFVSNAGKSIRRSIFDALDRPHDFTRTMNLNYFAPVQLMLGLIPKETAARLSRVLTHT